MRDKFVGSMNHLIKWIYILFMLWTFLGALRDSNLEINNATGISVGVLILLVVLFFIFRKIGFSIIGKIFLGKYKFWVAGVLAIAVIAFQMYFVLHIHPDMNYDVYFLYSSLNGVEQNHYYTLCPNNIPILLFMHLWCKIFDASSWLFLDLLTLFWTDLSAICNILALYFVNKKLVVPGIYMHVMWLSLFPMIIVPYTDCWVIPFVSFYILMWIILRKRSCKLWCKILLVIVMTLAVVGAYFIKPSAVIPFIAIAVVELLNCIKSGVKVSKIVLVMSFVFTGMISYSVINHQVQNQKYVTIQKDRGSTPLYFVSLGLSEYGKYNTADAMDMENAKSRDEVNEISKRKIKERIKNRGPLGYIKFLLFKHNLNTSDGTFGWLVESFIAMHTQPPKANKFVQTIRNYIYPNGTKLHDFAFVAQLWWIVWLGILLFGTTNSYTGIKQMMRLSIIGGMLFLLIFEGGRSRYLIQFLPVFLILATIQAQDAKMKIKNLLSGIV